MKPLPALVFIDAPRYRPVGWRPASRGRFTTLADLCKEAKIPLRATAPPRSIYVYCGTQQVRTPDIDFVGVPTKRLRGPTAALRALEALAHSFHDHAARHCVCGCGLFGPPVNSPDAR